MNTTTFINNNTGNAIDYFLLWKSAHRSARRLGWGHLTKEELSTITNDAATRLGINKDGVLSAVYEALVRVQRARC